MSANNYKISGVPVTDMLATTQPPIGSTVSSGISGYVGLSGTFYKQDGNYPGISSGITEYSYQGTTLADLLPKFLSYSESPSTVSVDVSVYNRIGGFLYGGGGGGGGGGGSNQHQQNANGGGGGGGQIGQRTGFLFNVSSYNTITLVVGAGGGGGSGGQRSDNGSGFDGGPGGFGGSTHVQAPGGVQLITALGGGRGTGGQGGFTNGQNGYGGVTEATWSAEANPFNAWGNYARYAGVGGGGGNSGEFNDGGWGTGGSHGSALIFLMRR